jgi:hypothetical protein
MSYWHSKANYVDRKYDTVYRIYYGDRFVCRLAIDFASTHTRLEFNAKEVIIVHSYERYCPREELVSAAFYLLKGTEKLWYHQIAATVAAKAKLLPTDLPIEKVIYADNSRQGGV